jgi:heat shock protein HslJ
MVGFLVLITSGCGGPQERSTTIPPATSARPPAPSPAPRPHPAPPARKPHLVAGELWGRRFVAVSFERSGDRPGTEPVPHTRFGFSRERFGGRVRESIGWDDGCNGYGGFIRVRGGSMRVWNVAGTLVACVEVNEDGKPQIEHGPLLMNFFGGKMHWRLHHGHLAITRGTQTLRLREMRG